jgi:flagellar hook-associated protein 1 FlgK
MGTGILGIAVSGLNAAQAGIRATQQNIANVNTEGYRRQELLQSTQRPQLTGYGYVGNGVAVDAVRHQYNRFLDNEVLHNQAQYAHYQAASSRSALIDKLLGSESTGLNASLSRFFAATQEVANDPASSATRQNLLSAGENLAGRFNQLASQLQAQRTATNQDASGLATRINVLAGQIAQANTAIAQNRATTGQPANDLVDARDQLVEELSKLVDVSRQDQGDGVVNVFIGGGQALVLGQEVRRLNLVANAADPALYDPAINLAFERYGSVLADPQARVVTSGAASLAGRVSGGELGGVLSYRDGTLLPALNDLNRVAIALSLEVNAIHRNGLQFDASTPGGDFFTPSVTQQAGASGWIRLGESTSGTPIASQNYTATWNGTQFTVTRISDGSVSSPLNPGDEVVIGGVPQGFSLLPNPGQPAASFAPAIGDAWNLNFADFSSTIRMAITNTNQIAAAGATATGPGDNQNALSLGAVQTTSLLNFSAGGFTDTLAAAYNKMVNRTASLAAQDDLNLRAFDTLRQSAVDARQSQVGVNLDEEAVNLVRYQQAYQASARAMQIAASLFEELLGAVR